MHDEMMKLCVSSEVYFALLFCEAENNNVVYIILATLENAVHVESLMCAKVTLE